MASGMLVKEGLIPEYASLDGSSFSKNFLLISMQTENANQNEKAYFSKPANESGWTNIPSTSLDASTFIGYRQVYRKNSIHVFVQIYEFYPVQGRIWTNFYNNGSWSGWKSNIAESDTWVRIVNVPYTISPGAQYNTNLKTIIDNDLPSGCHCTGIAGFTTNDQNVLLCACYYGESNYSFQIRSFATMELSRTANIRYYCAR